MRTEQDSLGSVSIPLDRYYGIHTARALTNFGDITDRHDPLFLKAYLLVKKAAALANAQLGYLDQNKAGYIIQAIEKILEQERFEDILVHPLCGGAGTSLNMNVNEVIVNHALELAGKDKGDYAYIDPLDQVNMHQSTNDTYPSSLKVAMLMYLKHLEQELVVLQDGLQEKEKAFGHVVKLGRTELMDALPITVGMQFAAYAEAISRDRWRIFKARERIKVLNIGGTAIGTGFGAPQQYIFLVIDKLREVTGLNITRAENLIDATQNLDPVVEVSGLLKTLATNLLKISQDLRLLSSGPTGGIGELLLPPVQEGSSIMPGKLNPVIPEFVAQISLLVMSNDSAISHAAGLGNLELNQFYPLVSFLVLKNMQLLRTALNSLNEKLLKGLGIHHAKIAANLSDSVALLTYLSQFIGHDAASRIHNKMEQTGSTVKELVLAEGLLSGDEFDSLVSPERIMMMGLKK